MGIPLQQINSTLWIGSLRRLFQWGGGSLSLSCDKTALDTLQAILDGKNVRMNIIDESHGTTSFYYGIHPVLVYGNTYYFIVAEVDSKRACTVKLVNQNSIPQWYLDISTAFVDMTFASRFDSYNVPECYALKFNHTDRLPLWDSIEYKVNLGDALEQLINGALLQALRDGKVTLGADLSATMGEEVYDLAERVHFVAKHGQGSMVRTTDFINYERNFRIISTYHKASDQSYEACFHGRIGWGEIGNTTTYDVTVDFFSKMIEGDGNTTYESYVAITVDPVTITFIPT